MLASIRLRIGISIVALLISGPAAHAASLNIVPASVSVAAGQQVTVSVTVASVDQALNAISGTVSFPTNLLSIASVSKANSVLSLWVQEPTFSNLAGSVQWSGVVPNPGFAGTGTVFSIRFLAKKEGTATVYFTSSAVLANDGNGTNILTGANPSTVTISTSAAPVPAPTVEKSPLLARITSSTHPDQTKWYSRSNVVLDWTNAQGVSAVRLGYDTNADGTPGVLYDEPISHKELQLGDGIWYFHVREKGADGWGQVATFRIQIDTEPPDPLVITFPNGAATATSTIAVEFAATDALSGIDHYVLSVDGADTTVSASEGGDVYALPAGDAGTHTLSVTVYDKAGNSVAASQQFTSTGQRGAETPSWGALAWLIANYLALILLALAALAMLSAVAWYLWHRFHTFRRRVVNKEDRMHILVHRQFNELRSSITSEIRALEDLKSKRNLTVEEERLANRLQKLLSESEHVLNRELDAELEQ
ncbi:MAG: hypothetical protein UY97_C0009G0005 [Parcubacteria group bacterium GW2011_GWB1_57_6]|nr:MAG: hypothetical protein UY93_C0002G0412 [Parcubacteria group bacterium GW2011_GWA1_56_13]KKW46148.1 MAG: hypothetical protein UY97_C0009G0005 [Parcubacteria group bacterium GW2011_GWB1_57_6]